jgi:hypothetical protein
MQYAVCDKRGLTFGVGSAAGQWSVEQLSETGSVSGFFCSIMPSRRAHVACGSWEHPENINQPVTDYNVNVPVSRWSAVTTTCVFCHALYAFRLAGGCQSGRGALMILTTS